MIDPLKPLTSRIFTGRLVLFYLWIVVWVALVLGRLLDLQVFKAEAYQWRATQQNEGSRRLVGQRGDVLDRQLQELAVSVPVDSVSAAPQQVGNPAMLAEKLAPLLEVSVHSLRNKLAADRIHVYLKRRLTSEVGAQVRANKFKGIYLEREEKRVYPGKEIAGHLLGFLGEDGRAWSGLENNYDSHLRGSSDRIMVQQDGRQRSFGRDPNPPKTEGDTLVLHLDSTIQFAAEQALRTAVESWGAGNGSAIVMDPHSGAILAMASYPRFDPNNYNTYSPQSRRNRAIQDTYEPGSTFKITTLAAVLNEGLARLDEVVDSRTGTAVLGGKVYREALRSYGDLTVAEIFSKSSNVGTVKLAQRLGEHRLQEYIKRFGFGDSTGVDLPFEARGFLRPVSEWSKLSIGALSIGQELTVTSLQMLRAVAIVANGGYLVRPRVVRHVVNPEGNLVASPEVERERVIRKEVAALVREAMELTVTKGTGRSAALNGFSSAGKTGTAQKYVVGGYSKEKYVSSFAGFAPAENPVISVIVVIDEPVGEYFGGRVAAPVFKEIAERALIRLGVVQDQPRHTETVAKARRMEPKLRSRSNPSSQETFRLNDPNYNAGLQEDDGPDRTSVVVNEAFERFRLPDFRGMTLRRVAEESARLGMALSVTGQGRVTVQRPEPQTLVSVGSTCEVILSGKGEEDFGTSKIIQPHPAALSVSRVGGRFED